MRNPTHHVPAFTLVETLLYMAIFSMMLGALFSLYWMAVSGWTKSHALLSVHEAALLLQSRISQDVGSAKSILQLTETSVCLESFDAAYNPTNYYLQDGTLRIAWGGGNLSCTTFSNDEPLSNAEVVIDANFSGTPNTPPIKLVNMWFDVTQRNVSNRNEFSAATAVSSSAIIRSQQP